MDKAVRPAPAGRRDHYERRRPEETALYQLVQEYLGTFLAQVGLETGAGLPDFVQEEFDAFFLKKPNADILSKVKSLCFCAWPAFIDR
jgi:hypothetical protein